MVLIYDHNFTWMQFMYSSFNCYFFSSYENYEQDFVNDLKKLRIWREMLFYYFLQLRALEPKWQVQIECGVYNRLSKLLVILFKLLFVS